MLKAKAPFDFVPVGVAALAGGGNALLHWIGYENSWPAWRFGAYMALLGAGGLTTYALGGDDDLAYSLLTCSAFGLTSNLFYAVKDSKPSDLFAYASVAPQRAVARGTSKAGCASCASKAGLVAPTQHGSVVEQPPLSGRTESAGGLL